MNDWNYTYNSPSIITSDDCPSGSFCLEMKNSAELIRYASTVGYQNVEVTFELQSDGLSGNEVCEVWTSLMMNNEDWDGWDQSGSHHIH